MAFLRCSSGNVNIEGNSVSVDAADILTVHVTGYSLSGGNVFNPIENRFFSFALTMPEKHADGYGIYVSKPKNAGVASIFSIGIFEL